MRIRIGEDFHGLRHFQRFVDGVRLAVHFGADDVVTDFGMDGVSQIHRCCPVRQGDDVAFRGVDLHFPGDEFFFDGVVELQWVIGDVLHFFEARQPFAHGFFGFDAVRFKFHCALFGVLVPDGDDARFSQGVHIAGTDLYVQRGTIAHDDAAVQ